MCVDPAAPGGWQFSHMKIGTGFQVDLSIELSLISRAVQIYRLSHGEPMEMQGREPTYLKTCGSYQESFSS